MITHQLRQGTEAWASLRAGHLCASEAAAMLGFSPYMKRNELLHAKKTCSPKEFSEWAQKYLLDKGHQVEAATRKLAEQLVGEDLYPVTGTVEVEGLALLASFDGLTAGDDTNWENKLWNADLVRAIKSGDLPDSHWPQVEQQMLVSGATRCLFTVSQDGTEENTELHWYESKADRRAQVIAGWKQFLIDLEAYKPVDVIPAAKAEPVKQLPAIIYKRDGLALTHNLDEYKTAALQLVADSKKRLETDQDFANCEALCKAFKEAEGKIEVVKGQVVGEIQDVDQFCRDLTFISEQLRQARLAGEKQVKERKDQIRYEILERAQTVLGAHKAALNERLGKPYMPDVKADIAGAMKGKRTIDSLKDAADTEVSKVKIAMNEVADRIQINIRKLQELAADHKELFADTATLVQKPTEDVVTTINYRIGEHKRKEEARLEAERAKIRAEEEAKAKAEAEAKLRAEAQEKAKAEAEAKAAEEAKARAEQEAKAKQEAEEKAKREAEEKARIEAEKKPGPTDPAPAAPQPAEQKPAGPAETKPAPEPAVVPAATPIGMPPDQRFREVVAEPPSKEEIRAAIDKALADLDEPELAQALAFINSIRGSRTRVAAA